MLRSPRPVDASDGSTPPKDAAPDVVRCVPGAGSAVSFSASTAQITIPGTGLPLGNSPRTVELWVATKTTSWASNTHPIVSYGTAAARQAFALDMETFPNIELYDWGDPSVVFDTGLTQQAGWFHLAATYDGTKLHAFVNGVEKGSNTPPQGLATPATAFNVGRADARHFDGIIDEVRVWSVARTAAQIASTMSIKLTGNEPNLVGYWNFDENKDSTAHDLSSVGANGLLENGVTWVPSGATLNCPP